MTPSLRKIIGSTGAIVAVIGVGLFVWRAAGGTTVPITIPLLLLVVASGLLIAARSTKS